MSEIRASTNMFIATMHSKRVLEITQYCYIENESGAGTDNPNGKGGVCIQINERHGYCNFPLSPEEVTQLRKWLELQERDQLPRRWLRKIWHPRRANLSVESPTPGHEKSSDAESQRLNASLVASTSSSCADSGKASSAVNQLSFQSPRKISTLPASA